VRDPIAVGGSLRLDEIVRSATRALADAGVETPGGDVRRLLAAATGLGPVELIARPERIVSASERARLEVLVRRRCAREPVSRILGEREFFGRAFALSPATLDPRPDSETVIEAVLALADEFGLRDRPLRILDVGTGSGCLLVTLLAELPLSTGLGTDVSVEALEVAAANARRHGVMSRVHFALHDVLSGINGLYDVMVCNPPYIASGEIAQLSPEVREHDPRAALDGGIDGLDFYRRIIPALPRVVPCGWAAFEVGAGQHEAVAQLLRDKVTGSRGGAPRLHQDLGGHVRCVTMEIQL
jgi:release factor glutamine methyltransferase